MHNPNKSNFSNPTSIIGKTLNVVTIQNILNIEMALKMSTSIPEE